MKSSRLRGQEPELSKYEYAWVFFHPIAAIKLNSIKKQCAVIYTTFKSDERLDTYSNGGKLDAYRHVFYMAAFSQKIKSTKVKKLGIAHEKNNYHHFLKSETEFGDPADSVSSVMDLKNNILGIEIGSSNKKISLSQLSEQVIAAILIGKAAVLKRDPDGNFINCENKGIDLSMYSKKWFVPKCLVASDYISE